MKKVINWSSGAAMVEFALVLPLLLVLVFGIMEFGAILYNQAVITNASREGARYAATYYINPANGTSSRPSCAEIQTFVATYVNANFLSFTSSTPFSTSNVSCPDGTPYSDHSGYAGFLDTIRIQYQYDFLVLDSVVELVGGSFSSPLTLTAQTAMRDENQNN